VEAREELLAIGDLAEVAVRREHDALEHFRGLLEVALFFQEDLREDRGPVAVVLRELVGQVLIGVGVGCWIKRREEMGERKRERCDERVDFFLSLFSSLLAHQRVVRDNQLAAQLPTKGVHVRGLHLLDDLLLLGVAAHHLAARGTPLLGALVVVVARGVADVVSRLGRGQVDADGGVGAVDGGVDRSLCVKRIG